MWCMAIVQFHSFLHAKVKFSQYHLLKRLSFPLCIFWLLCCKLIDHKCVGLFLALQFPLLIYVPVFMPIPYSSSYYSFIVQSEVREHGSTSVFLLSQDCFGQPGSFVVPYKFQDSFFYFCEKCHWNFDRDCTEPVDCFWQYGHFNNNNSSNQ